MFVHIHDGPTDHAVHSNYLISIIGNFLGQRVRSSFIVLGQMDKLKILTRDRDGTSQDSLLKSGTGQSLFFSQNLGWDTGQDNHYFFSVLKRTFPVLEHPFLF